MKVLLCKPPNYENAVTAVIYDEWERYDKAENEATAMIRDVQNIYERKT